MEAQGIVRPSALAHKLGAPPEPSCPSTNKEHLMAEATGGKTTYFADFNGTWGPWETRETRLKGRDLTEWPPTTGVDPSHTKLVGRARLQLLLLQLAVVRNSARVILRRQRKEAARRPFATTPHVPVPAPNHGTSSFSLSSLLMHSTHTGPPPPM